VLRALEKHDLLTINGVSGTVALVDRNSEELVPGDIIHLNEGEKVPADARVIHSDNLRSDEAMLTGESIPVSKNNHPVESR
jgi:P-type E1-E2 ATPase